MCQKDSKIHLCTCNNSNSYLDFQIHSSMNIAIVIKWRLSRLIKNEWIGMDGMLLEPADQFSSKITADFICNEMNNNQCFDFEFVPNEGDTIIFDAIVYNRIERRKLKKRKQTERKFISLIFSNEKWIIDAYDPFYNTLEDLKEGYLKLNE